MNITRNAHVPLPVLAAAAAALVVPLFVAVPSTAVAEPQISLQKDRGSAMSSATIEVPTNRKITTSTFTMLAVTWSGDDPGVTVRTHTDGRWTDWVELEQLGDGPSASSQEGAAATQLGASELQWVGSSDAVQVRTDSEADDLEVVLINPGVESSDANPPVPPPAPSFESGPLAKAVPTVRRATVPRPKIYRRWHWGADESWRDGTVRYTRTFKQMHVHHTANANRYSVAETPGIIRGIYRYHTKTLGWSDIGYNFLIDRFGRTWEGRAGGIDRLVQGAHTLGFNHNSTGVAVIGNYNKRTVSTGVLQSLADLGAWKFHSNNAYPMGKIWMNSTGSDRYPRGAAAYLYRIDGHRDTNHTSCPGYYLYRELPKLRRMVHSRMYTS